ncbi:MAG: glycoside hydrolase family 30 protein [Bradymonadia bacterium]
MYRSLLPAVLLLSACGATPDGGVKTPATEPPRVRVLLTSSAGDAMREVSTGSMVERAKGDDSKGTAHIVVHPDRKRQVFQGVGGSLTQASAAALKTVSAKNRQAILEAYFGADGARLALSRTHIASSDFSEYSYTYAPEADPELKGFSIHEDRKNGLLELITDAQKIAGARFKMIASPWTAPPWMKDSQKFFEPPKGRGGKLLPEHYETFARYFVKYIQAYKAAGVDIWAVTPVNEPQGNNGTWESMEMSPEEQREFVRVLGRTLRAAGLDTRILIFDQNRGEMPEYTKVLFGDKEVASLVYGTAVHWYNSTFKVYEEVLDAEHARYPDKVIIHSEGTIDSVSGKASCDQACPQPPCGCEELYAWWQADDWYWKKEATDWGWDWAPDRRDIHPKYAPAFRYARDLVVGMDHWLAGWVDWNIVLNKRGGPNHVGNFCLAPIMVDGETDTVHYTPLFHVMKQVSRHSRPGGVVLETERSIPNGLHTASIQNPDGTIAVHVFNESGADVDYVLRLGKHTLTLKSPRASLQTVVITP